MTEATEYGSDPVRMLRQALDAVVTLVQGVRPEQWSAPTPCTDWDVAALVDHLSSGNRRFAAILNGEPPPTPGAAGRDGADESRAAADALATAFERPGVLQEVHRTPLGELPGAAVVQLRLTETLVHGWDLARATGQRLQAPDFLAEAALAFTEPMLANVPPERRPFAAAQPAPADAPAIDRLAALLGRPLT